MLNLGPSKDHELKAEGALEAAQDPNSNVTSEAAQEVLAAEAKKAGAVSYNFDPNASPEEKAAKAKLVSWARAEVGGPGLEVLTINLGQGHELEK